MTSPIPSPTFSMPSPSQTFSFPSTSEPVFSVSTSEPAFESPNSQTSQNTQSQQQFQQYHTTTVSNNNAKFPYLKKDEYETWAMKMEYWIMNSDHNLWNIVLNGNSRKKTRRDPKGNIMILPPVSVEEHIAVQRETKARTILLQSLPEDHMADFHHLDDARDIWLAVKARFGGNDESKKMRKSMLKQEFLEFRVSKSEGLHKGYDRFQKILSQLNQMQAKPDNEDCNMKFLRALPPSWSQVAITLKTKGGLDYLSFDDLYNKLRTLEIDVKGGSSYDSRGTSAPTHSAFISAASTNSKMSYADSQNQSPSITFTTASSSADTSSNVIESVLHSFVAESDPQQQITYEDFDQIGKLDLEELDIKWQMAMLSVRINRFEKKAGRKMKFNNRDAARKLVGSKQDHEGEDVVNGDAQVYGMIAGAERMLLVNATWDVADDAFYAALELPHGISSQHSVPAGSRNRPTSVPAGSRNRPTSVPAGLAIITNCIWMREDGELLLRDTSAGLFFGEFKAICNGDPRTMENPHKNRDLGIVDSGCSRSMTGNKEKLDDFVKIIGGTVTFGGGDGKITRKGTIRTSKLNFENVYYVEELQNFNLFSVSQLCDTKNKVLFTDKECLVLSKEFQLPENSQVVLRVPRRNNLYCFNLSDIKPERDVTCLLAKASLAESTTWHRRMAHVNFKNMNKLAKHGLVNGLPSKLFTNEHNCVACNKGKQHKASYKAITAVSTISAPLQLLHMDLFGPTSIRSIDHKYKRYMKLLTCVESSSDMQRTARLQDKHLRANATAEKHLSQADLAASRNRVPTGKVVTTASLSDGPAESSTPVFTHVHTDATSLPPVIHWGSS
ncbi:ribonuclease H-like domain-containing protein [Tanacetum coccineum]